MSRDGSIVASGLWKSFRPDPPRRLGDRLRATAARLRGGPAPRRWVLRDINLEVRPGESVGIVGDNGSGKTTLLKTMNRVMYPTAGHIETGGRVGALIEVRAGLHPELTGRENTLLSGVLLGLKRHQVVERFDAIVEFAELEDAIDRQLKFYSAGMQMRLGFAVAAFLEPDVLLVDEALAVGDVDFQQRCLDRIRSVLEQGTTVVFVSHDLEAVQSVCERTLWIREGVIRADGPSEVTLGQYRGFIESGAAAKVDLGVGLSFTKATVEGDHQVQIVTGGSVRVRIVIDSLWRRPATVTLGISDGPPKPFLTVSGTVPLSDGQSEISCVIPDLPLAGGRYFLWMNLQLDGETDGGWHPIADFNVIGRPPPRLPLAVVRAAPVVRESSWEVSER